jgi:hypothetical protein
VSGYRNDLEAAQRRIDTLEAQIGERDASLKARRAELAELDNKLRRLSLPGVKALGRARARGVWAAVSATVMVAFVVGGFSGMAMGTAEERMRLSAGSFDRPEPVAQVPETPVVIQAPVIPAPLPEVTDPWVEGEGTLVAIAIGGPCQFKIDGVARGTRHSVRLRVAEGPHQVSCTSNGNARVQQVNVRKGKPGIASFRL